MDNSIKMEMYTLFQTIRGVLLQRAVAIVSNCSMSTSNKSYFEKFDGVGKLLKLNGTCSERLTMSVLFALAYLSGEKEKNLFESKTGKQIMMLYVGSYIYLFLFCFYDF